MSETSYRIVLHREAVREIRRLPGDVKSRIKDAVDGLAAAPVPPGARRIRGRVGAYRLRVGDYRVVYEVHATEIVVYVVGVGHRRDVYRRILRRR